MSDIEDMQKENDMDDNETLSEGEVFEKEDWYLDEDDDFSDTCDYDDND